MVAEGLLTCLGHATHGKHIKAVATEEAELHTTACGDYESHGREGYTYRGVVNIKLNTVNYHTQTQTLQIILFGKGCME